jgi:[ribosomal protein S18]-alanine N-acetyltransferase
MTEPMTEPTTEPTTEIDTPRVDFSVAPMTADLLHSVVALEEACGLNSRGQEGYRKMLSNPKSVLLVVLTPKSPISPVNPVIGLFSGEVVVDELQIDNLAVAERWRRQGIGGALLKSGLSQASGLGARAATLEVRSTNATARMFYEKEGFTPVGLRRRYYADPPDDALLLSREI